MSDDDRQRIIAEARAIIDGDDMVLWPIAAALQLGYRGEAVVLRVAEVILFWHDLYAVKTDRVVSPDGQKRG